MDTLRNLQQQIFDNEKGRAISSYMSAVTKTETVCLFVIALALIVIGATLRFIFAWEAYSMYCPLLLIVPGLFVGLVFSSFMRCRTITFYDLHAIEADRFTPALKIVFALVILLLAASR